MRVDVKEFNKFCSCGKTHRILVKDIIIEEGAISKLPNILRNEGFNNPVVVCDENTYSAAGDEIYQNVSNATYIKLTSNNLHADEMAVAKVYEMLPKETDVLIALGSGTIHDITRYVSFNKDIPFISVPTAASVDGFVSTVAAMTWKGFKKTFSAVSPIYVVADTNIFSEAPYRLTASGVSDLLGKYTALIDWKISSIITNEYICNRICNMEIDAVNKVCECVNDLKDGERYAYEQLMYALILSGLAMQMVGNSRPASGAEHHLSHLWEMEVINPHIDALHGEKVSVGLILVLKEYKKIRDAIMAGKCYVREYTGLDTYMLRSVFKKSELYHSVIRENTPDPLDAINRKTLERRLPKIAEALGKLPSVDFVEDILTRANAVKSLEEVGLSEEIVDKSIKVSPYVRNRLTLMRISKLLNY